jgi:multidrug efflux system membrane fusion protein
MRIRFSYLAAVALAVGVSYYMLTGKTVIGGQPGADTKTIAERQSETGEKLFAVQVEVHRARNRASRLEVRGRTEADAIVKVRAQTGGILEKRLVEKGQSVAAGDLLCLTEGGARLANLAKARASLKQAEIGLQAQAALVEKGYAARNAIAGLEAGLDAAKAVLAEAELELSRIEIRAPIAGIVQDPLAYAGDVLAAGSTCVTIIDSDPMKVIGQVSEREIGALATGMRADVRLVGDLTASGVIDYIAPSADPQTRTFRVEIRLANEDGRIKDGVTAVANVPLPASKAHMVSSAYLTLDGNGRIGVRIVDENDIVRFAPVDVIGAEGNALWVGGLAETVRVITVGQDYVLAGQKVKPMPADTASLMPPGTPGDSSNATAAEVR